MSFEHLLLNEKDSIATIALNRPEKLNALNLVLAEEISNALEKCEQNKMVRVVIVKALGRAFCAGGDVEGMRDSLNKDPYQFLRKLARSAHNIMIGIRNLPKPVIAQVQGIVSGAGFGLVLACDFVIASENSRFNLAYSNIGASPDMGSTFVLPKLIGLQKANDLFFTGRTIDAEEGSRMGFINQIVSDEKIEDITMDLAKRLTERPALALAKTKALINQSLFWGLESQLETERTKISESATTEDFAEGVNAFFEKRSPLFKGR